MELFKNTTDLLGLKDNNITISFILKHQTHIEIRAKLDYLAPTCPFLLWKYDQIRFSKTIDHPDFECSRHANPLKTQETTLSMQRLS